MSGLYEATPEVPQMRLPGLDANMQRQIDAQFNQIRTLNRMTLEFDGSIVRMGTASAISECRYRIDGNRLEVIVEAMGQKTILPMMIESDGSISYLTMRFRKKQ